MTHSEITKQINSKINKSLVEFFREQIDDMSFLGRPVLLSENLLLIESVSDFVSNGYRVVRIKDISDISTGDKNDSIRFMNDICVGEGVFEKYTLDIDISSYSSVFSFINQNKLPVTIECTCDDGFDYYFGWVTSVSGNVATIRCYDGAGILFNDEIKINLSFVTQVMIYEKYTELTAKYAKR